MGKLKDLTGMKFGKWTVIKRNGSDKHGKALWLCRCECGTERNVLGESLNSGKSNNCGRGRCHKGMSGKDHPNYNPNLSDEERHNRRKTNEYREWAKDVKEQANYTCDCCGERGGKLHSHHLDDWHTHEDLRYAVSNGVCLCESCHKEFHYHYMQNSKKPCTEDDYLDFKEIKEKYDIH